MDANQDGIVTLPEMEAAMSRRVQERFNRFDTNGDGGVTLQEVLDRSRNRNRRGPMTLQDLDASTMRVFDRADRNKDGMISPDEASSMRRGQRN